VLRRKRKILSCTKVRDSGGIKWTGKPSHTFFRLYKGEPARIETTRGRGEKKKKGSRIEMSTCRKQKKPKTMEKKVEEKRNGNDEVSTNHVVKEKEVIQTGNGIGRRDQCTKK